MSDKASRLRSARINAGFQSARSAALRFQWSPSTYAAHENGQNSYNGDQAVIYARAFRVQPEWLYIGSGYSGSDYGHVFNINGVIGDGGELDGTPGITKKVITLEFMKVVERMHFFEIETDSLVPSYRRGQLLCAIEVLDKRFDRGFFQDVVVSEGNRGFILGRFLEGEKEGSFDLIRFGYAPMRNYKPTDMFIVVSRVDRFGWLETGEGAPSMLSDAELNALIEREAVAGRR